MGKMGSELLVKGLRVSGFLGFKFMKKNMGTGFISKLSSNLLRAIVFYECYIKSTFLKHFVIELLGFGQYQNHPAL